MFLDVLTDRAASDYCASPWRTLIRRKSRDYPLLQDTQKTYLFLYPFLPCNLVRSMRAAKPANESGITRDIISELIAAKISQLTAIAFLRASGLTNTVESQRTSSLCSKSIARNQICLVSICRANKQLERKKHTGRITIILEN